MNDHKRQTKPFDLEKITDHNTGAFSEESMSSEEHAMLREMFKDIRFFYDKKHYRDRSRNRGK